MDNLSKRITIQWVWKGFNRAGQVVDVFLSRKMRESSIQRFAFVTFAIKNHSLREIQNMDGRRMNGVPLSL
ncbi:hypothetical protein AHAS_Ahas18G0178300 [Arachis hypogaea]